MATDSSAAKGIAMRKGMGKVKHLETGDADFLGPGHGWRSHHFDAQVPRW